MAVCNIDKAYAKVAISNKIHDIIDSYHDSDLSSAATEDTVVIYIDSSDGKSVESTIANIQKDIESFNASLIKDREHYPIKVEVLKTERGANIYANINIGKYLLKVINEINYINAYNEMVEKSEAGRADAIDWINSNRDLYEQRLAAIDKELMEGLQDITRQARTVHMVMDKHLKSLRAELNRMYSDISNNSNAKVKALINTEIEVLNGEISTIEGLLNDGDIEKARIYLQQLAAERKQRMSQFFIAKQQLLREKEGEALSDDEKIAQAFDSTSEEIERAARTYYAHLNKQIREIEAMLMAISNKPDSKRTEHDRQVYDDLYAYYTKLKGLQHLKHSDSHDVSFLTFIDKEITFVLNMLQSGGDINNVFRRLDFLTKMLTGVGLDNQKVVHPDFYTLAAVNTHAVTVLRNNLNVARDLFNHEMRVQVGKNLLDNVAVRNFMEAHGIAADSIQDFLSYLKAHGDASWFDINLTGVAFSSADDGLLPQVLKAHYEQIRVAYAAEAVEKKRELQEVAKNVKGGFDFVFEKDSQGRKTGFIASLFRSSWHTLLRHINLYDDVKGEIKKRNAFLREHGEVLQYAMMPEIYNFYSQSFPQAFRRGSDEERNKYKQYLIDKIGEDKYYKYVQRVREKIDGFLIATTGNTSVNHEMHIANPFTNIESALRGKDVQRFAYLEVIPRDERHYNRDYNNLSLERKAYLDKLTELYDSYISLYIPEYEHMSYGKFLMDIVDYISKNGKGSGKNIKTLVRHIKSIYINRKNASLSEDALPSYIDGQRVSKDKVYNVLKDRSIEEIRQYAGDVGVKLTSEQVTKEELIEEFANAISLQDYYDDINTITETMLDLAAQTATRTDMLPIAQSYLVYFNSINPGNSKSYRNMVAFVNQVVKGMRPKDIAILSKEAGKVDVDSVKGIKDVVDIVKRSHKGWHKKLTDMDEKMMKIIRKFANIDIDKTEVSFTYEGLDYTSVTNQDGTLSYIKWIDGEPHNIERDVFEELYAKHIVTLINDIGIGVSIGSVMRGLNTIVVMKYLALNPVAGFINRHQGIKDNDLADTSGYYWTEGNLADARKFLNGIILYRNSGSIGKALLPPSLKRQYKIMTELIERMDILQEKASAYERNLRDKNKYKVGMNFQLAWSISIPESKNQLEIFLSLLKDVKIKDDKGKEYNFYSDGKFIAYDATAKGLVLKPQFRTEENIRNWEKFNHKGGEHNEMLLFMMKHIQAVSHIQNNFDKNDTMTTINSALTQTMLSLKRWIVSQAQQRLDTGKGWDLLSTKRRKEGRFITGTRHPASLAAFIAGYTGLAVGLPTSFIAPFVGVPAVALAVTLYRRITIKTARKQVKIGAHSISEIGGFYLTAVSAALGFPLKWVGVARPGRHIIDKVAYNKLRQVLDKEGNRLISEEDIGNLKALAAEFGNMLFYFTTSLAVLAMLYDDDDDKYAKRRRMYNYFSNKLAALLYDGMIFLNPMMFLQSGMGVPAVNYITSVIKSTGEIAGFIDQDNEEVASDHLNKALPIPNTILSAIKYGTPFEDDREASASLGLSRTAKHIATEGEYTFHREYLNMRKNASNRVMDIANDMKIKNNKVTLNSNERTAVINKAYGKKDKDVKYKDMVERYKNTNVSEATIKKAIVDVKTNPRRRR